VTFGKAGFRHRVDRMTGNLEAALPIPYVKAND
jgi:hypothetical protein